MTTKTRKIITSVLLLWMMSTLGFSAVSAQYSSDQWDTKLNIVSEWWELLVNTFDIDFGNVSSSATDRLVSGAIVGNQWYIITKDTLANKLRYVTIDATDMIGSGSGGTWVRVIKDSKLVMTTTWWTSAITVLSGNATTEIRGVAQTDVNFSGSNGYTIMERIAFTSWITGKYGVIPMFKLTIPGYTPVGSYVGTIEVSLYMP